MFHKMPPRWTLSSAFVACSSTQDESKSEQKDRGSLSDAEAATCELSSQRFRVALECAFRKVHNTLKVHSTS
jgi:hypothetical protein